MYKRKRVPSVYQNKPFKKPRTTPREQTRVGYSTVARTRGVYAKGEMKYFESALIAKAIPASVDWTATEMDPTTQNCLFVPQQGSSIQQRIGQKATLHKLKIRGSIVVPPQANKTVTDSASQIRLILYQDMQTNGSFSQGENLMNSQAASAIITVNSFQNVDNFGRFKVLKDKTLFLQNPNISWDGTNMEQQGLIKSFKLNVNFKTPIQVRFNATNGGTVADIVDNSFHLIAATTSATLVPDLTYAVRASFKG